MTTSTYKVWACHKCKDLILGEPGVWCNAAPHSASGGDVLPFHAACVPVVFQGPSFSNDADKRDAARYRAIRRFLNEEALDALIKDGAL